MVSSQTIPYKFLLIAGPNVPVTFIHTDFIRSSRIDFDVSLSLIDLKELIWILSSVVGMQLFQAQIK